MNINSSLKKTPIAVIGLSAIFADARNVEEYWTNIIQGRDSIKDVPANRWLIDDYYDPDMTAPDKTYCKRGGFLPEIDFNPMEFGLPPNILEVTDASQLLGLVAARDAFEDAGYGRESTKFTAALKEKTGVLLGVGGGQKLITPLIARLQYPIWERALRASGIAEEDIPRIVDKMKKAYVGWNENSFPGLLGNVISGRITNRFDLGGINSVVDAACAASLSAIKMSLSELVEGRCDMMLTGGVDTDNSPFMYMSFSKTPAFSKSGKISPFSNEADGMLIGEGIGMLVLKRLADAERDGDHIYATINGVGTSSDGRFKSVYAPRPSGQAMAMRRAYEDAGYAASSVGLLEAHGTGTGAGDPTEFTSMQMVFGENNTQKQHIALGSVKSQIGHTKSAAGAAGIIKTVLALHHRVLPPTINVKAPNEKFEIENSAIYINTEARPWMRNGHPRRAGVSAFGFGGINVHITLEEYAVKKESEYRLHEPFKNVLLKGANPAELLANLRAAEAGLIGDEGESAFHSLVQDSKAISLHQNEARVAFVCNGIEDCKQYLAVAIEGIEANQSAWEHPKGIYYRPNGIDTNSNKVAALFAGQGSQYIGMGKESANAFPELANSFAQIDERFKANGDTPLSNLVFPRPVFTSEEKKQQQQELTRTQNAQPAIGALSMGQYKTLFQSGFRPAICAGHSYGELTALWAAGVYDDQTFLALSKTRGAAMAINNAHQDAGTMLAVKAGPIEVEEAIQYLPDVRIANVNSNNQVVLGGGTAAIAKAATTLTDIGFKVIPLPVSAAFHTDYVGHAQTPFANFVAQQNFTTAQIPVYANTTASAYPENVSEIKKILGAQILNPVLFKNQIENMYAAGARIFVEFGPKGVLTNLVKNILKGEDFIAIALNPNARKDSDLQLRQAAVQLQVLGLPLTHIDPYKRELAPNPPKSKLTVKLSGNNYVSAATQKAYDDVMNDGFTISGTEPKIIEKIVHVEKNIPVPLAIGTQQFQNEEEEMNKEVFQLLSTTIDAFKSNQTRALEIFERYMNEQNAQSRELLQIMSKHMDTTTLEKSAVKTPVVHMAAAPEPVVPKTMGYTNGSNGSNGHSNVASSLVQSPAATTTVNKPVGTIGVNNAKLTAALLEVVSEKTGYPSEMLELSMDMEADLGIDSIKRVEIFGALTSAYPEMSDINPNELTELRTLGEIVDYVGTKNGTNTAVQSSSKPIATSEVKASNAGVRITPMIPNDAKAETTTTQVSDSKLEAALLEVVSEKTGYPAEMLELSMDMEADLGIDSIKRVEIFGALTAAYPEMSGINPNELTELRTLGEIVNYVNNSSGKQTHQTAQTSSTTPVQTQSAVVPDPMTNGSSNNAALEAMLLEVVSEKTGYPSEMLELSMDMEADLGIDSIKRVEIFGALTQKYPEMSDINPNELTELRTLGEIVNYVNNANAKKALS